LVKGLDHPYRHGHCSAPQRNGVHASRDWRSRGKRVGGMVDRGRKFLLHVLSHMQYVGHDFVS
jgi:hypothetical protein